MPGTGKMPPAGTPLPSGTKGIPLPLVLIIASVVLCVGIVGGVLLKGGAAGKAGPASTTKRPTLKPMASTTSRPGSGRPGGSSSEIPDAPGAPGPLGPRVDAASKIAIPATFGSPAEMLDVLRKAIQANDIDAMNAIDAHLKEYVAGDPARAKELVDIFKRETEPAILEILAGALLSDPQIANAPELVQGFLSIARDDRNSDRRGQALLFLSGVTEISPQLVSDIVTLARNETDMQVRIGSISALTQYMQTHKEFSGQINETFIEIAKTDKDETVRGTAIQSLNLRESGAQSLDAVSDVLRADQASGVRAVAAMIMGDAPPQQRQFVMGKLEEAFTGEQDREVKRSMITSVVRAGREDALQSLERMRSSDPKYTDDVNDYIEILRTGERDMDKIWDQKFQREQARGDVNLGDDHDDHEPDGGTAPAPAGEAPQ